MATIKSYSDLQQSKKLKEILPLESADMYYPWYIEEDRDHIKSGHRISIPSVGNFIHIHKVNKMILPCWSLSALLGIIGHYTLQTVSDSKRVIIVSENGKPISSYSYPHPVDACCEMILKLHELKML